MEDYNENPNPQKEKYEIFQANQIMMNRILRENEEKHNLSYKERQKKTNEKGLKKVMAKLKIK